MALHLTIKDDGTPSGPYDCEDAGGICTIDPKTRKCKKCGH